MMGRWCSGVEIVVLIGGGVGKETKGKKGKAGKGKEEKKGRGKKSAVKGVPGQEKGKSVEAGSGSGAGAGTGMEEEGEGGGDEDLGEVFVEEDEMDAMNG